MGCMKTFAIVTSVLIIGLSIYLYTPLPDGISEPWKLRSFLAVFKLVGLVCKIGEVAGYDSQLNMSRKIMTVMAPHPPVSMSDPLLKVTDTTFDGIKVRIYRPKTSKTPSPAMVYFHGGGWIIGSIELTDAFCAELSKMANIVIVSVEYRLAPEFPFPVPFEDCVTATLHLLQNYDQYGVHGDKIAVGGDGTGGNLAAAIAKRFSEEPPAYIQRLRFQILLYPALQAFDFNLPSYLKYEEMQILTKSQMVIQWIQYFGLKDPMKYFEDFSSNNHTSMILKYSEYAAGVSQVLLTERYRTTITDIVNKNEGNDALSYQIEAFLLDPHMSPLMALNLTQVSPAYIMTADFDVLRDDGIIYAERLRKAGVRVNTYHMKMAAHGFCSMHMPYSFMQLDVCHRALEKMVYYIKENMR